LLTGYLEAIFGKKHFVTFKFFANARTPLHICRETEGLGTGIAVKVCPYIYIHTQGVTGGTDQTSGECSLDHTIPT